MNLRLFAKHAVTLLPLICLAAVVMASPKKSTAPKTKIYKVVSVNLSVAGVNRVKISAAGEVRTGGWKDGELVARAETKKADETSNMITVHYDFVATKPTGIVTQVISPISAETSTFMPPAGKTLKVVVHSETNEEDGSIKSSHQAP